MRRINTNLYFLTGQIKCCTLFLFSSGYSKISFTSPFAHPLLTRLVRFPSPDGEGASRAGVAFWEAFLQKRVAFALPFQFRVYLLRKLKIFCGVYFVSHIGIRNCNKKISACVIWGKANCVLKTCNSVLKFFYCS